MRRAVASKLESASSKGRSSAAAAPACCPYVHSASGSAPNRLHTWCIDGCECEDDIDVPFERSWSSTSRSSYWSSTSRSSYCKSNFALHAPDSAALASHAPVAIAHTMHTTDVDVGAARCLCICARFWHAHNVYAAVKIVSVSKIGEKSRSAIFFSH